MNTQQKIVPFQSERDRLLTEAMHKLFFAIVLIRSEPVPDSVGIAVSLARDSVGILEACSYLSGQPHFHHCPIDLAELDRIVAEDQ